MLAEIVLVQKLLLHVSAVGVEHHGVPVHEGDLLHHNGVVHRLQGTLAPGERTVRMHHDAGNSGGVSAGKGFDDNLAGLLFVFARDLIGRHEAGAGDVTIEIIPVRRAHGGNIAPSLSERSRPAGVRMNDAAALGERLVKLHMRGGVA